MIKKVLVSVIAVVMILGIFGLAGCDGFNLDEYKANAEAAIQTHASTKIAEYDYTNAGLQVIAKAVADGKDAVDAADSKDKVDTAVSAAKAKIDAVPKKTTNSIEFDVVDFSGGFAGSSSGKSESVIVRSQEGLITLLGDFGFQSEDDIAIWVQYDNEYFESKVLVFHFFGLSGDIAPDFSVDDVQVNNDTLKLFIVQHGMTSGLAYFGITVIVEVSKSDTVNVTNAEADIRIAVEEDAVSFPSVLETFSLDDFTDDFFKSNTLIFVPFEWSYLLYEHLDFYTVFVENGKLNFLIEVTCPYGGGDMALDMRLFVVVIPNELISEYEIGESIIFETYSFPFVDGETLPTENCRDLLKAKEDKSITHRVGIAPNEISVRQITSVTTKAVLNELLIK